MGFRIEGLGYTVQGSGFRVHGSGFRVQGAGFRVNIPSAHTTLSARAPFIRRKTLPAAVTWRRLNLTTSECQGVMPLLL